MTRRLAMVKNIVVTVAAAAALTVFGCSHEGTSTPPTESVLNHVQASGTLKVGYFLFEPTMMQGEGGKPKGLFVDLIESIAEQLKWKVEYQQVDLKNFAAALQAGTFDLSIGATFSSPTRAGGVAFTQPLFYLGYTGLTKPENAQRFKTWADVDQAGVRVVVKQGSAIGDYAARNFKRATVVSLEEPALSAPLAAVAAGRGDIGLMNQITVFTYLRDNSQSGLVEVLADQPVEFTGICWAVRQGDPTWLEFVNSAIKHFQDTHRLAEWEATYGIPYMYHEKRRFEFNGGGKKGALDM